MEFFQRIGDEVVDQFLRNRDERNGFLGVEMRQFVSILMPVKNQVAYVGEALESVLCSGFESFEIVVVDGASTDGTIDVLHRYACADARVRWISEPDAGPGQAVNKALQRSRGTIIGWLNADDLYAQGAISRAVDVFSTPASPVMVYGEAEHMDEHGQSTGRYPTRTPDTPLQHFQDGCFICQPTVFFKRTVPLLVGSIDETFRTAFDFDYWLRIFKAFPGRIGFVQQIQAKSRWHSAAISYRMRREVALEGLSVLSRHLGKAPAHWALTHIDEMKNSQLSDLQGYLAEFLDDVRPYLSDNDHRWVCRVATQTCCAPVGAG